MRRVSQARLKSDPTYNVATLIYWTEVDITLSVIVASMPVLGTALWSRTMTSRKTKTSNPSSAFGNSRPKPGGNAPSEHSREGIIRQDEVELEYHNRGQLDLEESMGKSENISRDAYHVERQTMPWAAHGSDVIDGAGGAGVEFHAAEEAELLFGSQVLDWLGFEVFKGGEDEGTEEGEEGEEAAKKARKAKKAAKKAAKRAKKAAKRAKKAKKGGEKGEEGEEGGEEGEEGEEGECSAGKRWSSNDTCTITGTLGFSQIMSYGISVTGTSVSGGLYVKCTNGKEWSNRHSPNPQTIKASDTGLEQNINWNQKSLQSIKSCSASYGSGAQVSGTVAPQDIKSGFGFSSTESSCSVTIDI
ncbi:MAG: hypothetical protein Q9199_002821 [Rusavskia elegans]